jgi:hypothetical protein
LLLRKFRPFSGVPAGTDDSATGESVLFALGLRSWPIGEIVMGVVKGWVALEEGSEVVAGEEVEEVLVR